MKINNKYLYLLLSVINLGYFVQIDSSNYNLIYLGLALLPFLINLNLNIFVLCLSIIFVFDFELFFLFAPPLLLFINFKRSLKSSFLCFLILILPTLLVFLNNYKVSFLANEIKPVFLYSYPIFIFLLIYIRNLSTKLNNDWLVFMLMISSTYMSFTYSIRDYHYLYFVSLLVFFYISRPKNNNSLYLLLCSLIVIFFNLININVLSDFSFSSLLQILYTNLFRCLLLYSTYLYWLYLKSKNFFFQDSNLIIGLAGDSGSGKSTLMNSIDKLLKNEILVLEGDAEHKWERGHINWTKYTHLNPDANFLHKQFKYLLKLKFHRSIFRSDYDHSTGVFTDPILRKPKRFILIGGLHTFFLPNTRKLIDIKIFLNPSENLRLHWKICRDVGKRGYELNKVLDQLKKREIDANRFILPQKKYADIVVTYFTNDDFIIGDINSSFHLGLKIIVSSALDFDHLRLFYDFDIRYLENTDFVEIIFFNPPALNYSILISNNFNFNNFTDYKSITWEPGYQGLLQYIILLLINSNNRDA